LERYPLEINKNVSDTYAVPYWESPDLFFLTLTLSMVGSLLLGKYVLIAIFVFRDWLLYRQMKDCLRKYRK